MAAQTLWRLKTVRQLLHFVRAGLWIGSSWLVLAPSPARAQHPNVARGFSPSGVFDTGGIDVVNGFNGNLVIRIPIGGSYPVGGTMGSYSFSLAYNSKAWDFTTNLGGQCPGVSNPAPVDTLAIPSGYDNAGLGWRFSLGRVGPDLFVFSYNPPPPPAGSFGAYRGMDGSEHYLFASLATPGGGSVQQSGKLFSNDGSYLRYSSSSGTLEFPDGNVHTFDSNGFPTSIKDRFGNGLAISYTTDPQSCPGNAAGPGKVWAISDGYRTHKVCFVPTGYSSPEQTEVVDHIDLAGFGGVSTYKFLYNDSDQYGNGFHEVRLAGYGTLQRSCSDPLFPWQPRVYLLTKLLLPDGTSYSMPAANYSAASGFPGVLTGMRLPTSGSIAWDYTLKPLPQPHTDDNGVWVIPLWSSVTAVTNRRLYDSGGQLVGTWRYSFADGVSSLANEIVNQVVFPSPDPVLAAQGAAGHRVVTYYSACVYGTCLNESGAPDPPDTYAVDYALPFSRRRPDGTGRYLSQEIYAPGASTPLRQVHAAYDNDAPPPGPGVTSPVFVNQRPQSQRTVYLDDPLPGAAGFTSVSMDSSSYDGLGHYRTVTTSDNTGFSALRTERIDWNPGGLPGPGDPWILDTYDFREQQEGGDLRRQETVFEAGTGFLLCERRLAGGANRGGNDVMVTYDHGNPQTPGQVTAERWFGGDTQSLPTAPGCAVPPANPVYSYSHLYSAGVRSLTTVQVSTSGGGTNPLKVLDDDIDAGSGLVSASRDPGGRATVFTYDSMGRLLTSTPQGDATTRITYQLSDTSPPFVDRKVGSPALEEETWQLDGLGRSVAHTVMMPNNMSSTSVATLNAMGWKTFVSEPSANPGAQGTRYLDYDPFGRPARIVPADGKTTYLDYQGARGVTRTQRVFNGTREVPVTTREEYDGLGRLRRIRDPNGVWSRYRYDAGGKLSTATTNGSAGQTRNFHYDGRGFLVGEQHPESGFASYRYDARGNVTRKATPTGTLRSSYDEAGRLLSVITPQAALKQFSYGTGSDAGKLKQARAFNWRMGSTCSALEVRQDFTYDPTTGRLASENTSLWQAPAQPLESWTQAYAYDGAGRITQVSYPNCVSLCSSTPRQVTTSYAFGRPTGVPGFANAITYNDNGTLATIRHANGVVFTETPDPNGMPRPGSLRADSPAGGLWPQENYFYDGSGNIKAIGGKTFAYDAGSRIVSATVPTAGAQPYQAFSYDDFGNLVSIFRGADSTHGTYVNYTADPATNRLQGATYDDSGSLLAYQGSTYTWDVLGQATSINTGSETWTHTYDATGERVWSFRTSPARLDSYALRGQDAKVLSAFTKTGSTYTWEDYAYREGLLLGAGFSDGRLVHFDVDHLGSVRLETDGNGHVTYRDYWPYGEEATPPGGSERMKFTGHERDLGDPTSTADDIDYMHARYFRPIWGRFLSADPAGGDPKVPQSWNRYSYTMGNPMGRTDPTGEAISDYVTPAEEKVNGWLDAMHSSFWAGLLGTATGAGPILTAVSVGLDSLKAGDATGTAIGSGAGPGEIALAVAKDASRVLTLAGGLSLAGKALAGAGEVAAAGATEVSAATPVGRIGKQMKVVDGTNRPATINGTDYSTHALDRMQRDGLMPSAVENTLRTGARSPGNQPGTSVFYDSVNRVMVVRDSATGKIITVRPGKPP
jgi:RHS repeat-associated protein